MLSGCDGRPEERAGATWCGDGTHFVLRSRAAEAVSLCLFDDPADRVARRTVSLARHGTDRWHAFQPDVLPGQCYGYRVHGPFRPQEGHRFNAAKLLVDPFARAITGQPVLDDAVFGFEPARGTESYSSRDSAHAMPKCVVVDTAFDWQGTASPRTAWRDTLIYEAHVRGLTLQHPEIPAEQRGRYLGLASEPVIAHLKGLGVTAVELLPVAQIATEPSVRRRGFDNYWGYSPLGLFAPHAGYASASRGQQVAEFQTMVRALHQAGIEVILDIVLNHTAEGGHDGPTLSWRGIDNRAYYRLDPRNRRRTVDFTGCGNTLDVSSDLVRELVLDCLRFWVRDMHVDGFRFDLATTLGRGAEPAPAFQRASALFRAMAEDPVLTGTKWIAEPWDLGPGGYRLGGFPAGWGEWNDRFRDGVRRAWQGDEMTAGELAWRLAGSRDLLPRTVSINFAACHDGLTLADAVSYSRKHNHANQEDNRDGHAHEVCANRGTEGPSQDPSIRTARSQAVRNLLTSVFLADGVPMLGHGDELGRTQRGNNNAYCQDNASTWVDWRGSRVLARFIGALARLRRTLRADERAARAETAWRGPEADAPVVSDPAHINGPAFAMVREDVCVLVNPGPREIRFAWLSAGWRTVLNTAQTDPLVAQRLASENGQMDEARPSRADRAGAVAARSIVVLIADATVKSREAAARSGACVRGRGGSPSRD